MSLIESLARLMNRFRYPVSLPEDLARDLGMELPSTLSYETFMELLATPHAPTTRLWKFMPRHQAEAAFQFALKQENFLSCSFFSYYFTKGWIVIALYFDGEGKLRRAYLQCPVQETREGFDIHLEERTAFLISQ